MEEPVQESSNLLWLKVLIPVIAIILTAGLILGISPLFSPDARPSFSETPERETFSKTSSLQETPQPTTTPTLSPEALQEYLSKSWAKTENTGGYTLNYTLNFSNDVVVYNCECLQNTYAITGFDYEIISGNQIQRHYPDKVYTITFNEEKNVMTISPSISSNEKSEIWYLDGNSPTSDASEAEKEALEKALSNSWTRAGDSNGYYYTYELDFSDGDAHYRYFDDTNYSRGSGNISYKIISGNQIQDLDSNIIHTITFNDTKDTMTISPGLSSTAESESWSLVSSLSMDHLQKAWQRIDKADGFTIYSLSVHDTQIVYSYVKQDNQRGSDSFKYEAISNNQIRDLESGMIHTFTLNKAKNILIISPAISSTAESEIWYCTEE